MGNVVGLFSHPRAHLRLGKSVTDIYWAALMRSERTGLQRVMVELVVTEIPVSPEHLKELVLNLQGAEETFRIGLDLGTVEFHSVKMGHRLSGSSRPFPPLPLDPLQLTLCAGERLIHSASWAHLTQEAERAQQDAP